jgi:hypothetical protein
VREITSALTVGLTRQRQERHAAFASEALGGPVEEAWGEMSALRSTFKRVWRCSVDNRLKEVFYRVAGHAVPGGRVPAWVCPCSPGVVIGSAGSRVHSFWTCVVAVAVRAELERVLQQPVSRPDVWLFHAPATHIRTEVWDLVCLAALGAMEHGRKLGWAQQAEEPPQQQQQRQQQQQQQAALEAVARFWQLLDSCITPSLLRDMAVLPLGPTHPFLSISLGKLVTRGQALP